MISVGATQDGESFEIAEEMLTFDSLAGQSCIGLLFLYGERMEFGFLVGNATGPMPFFETLITRIREYGCLWIEPEARSFEESKIVSGTGSKSRR